MKENQKNNYKGVTLIELLVVITIMMTMVALVAPLSINTIDKAEAQSEYLSFAGLLRSSSIKAFTNGTGLNIKLNQNTVAVYMIPLSFGGTTRLEPSQATVKELTYEYLNFPDIEVKFNKNGIPNITEINFHQRNQEKQLNLIALLKY